MLARQALGAGDRQQYDKHKRSLPLFVFMAGNIHGSRYIDKQGNDHGIDMWRRQSECYLNGLVMLDFDHLGEDPASVFTERIMPHSADIGLLLAYVTPSADGIRLVCKADVKTGNLADNQRHIAGIIGLASDEACKDSSRGSFACTKEDVLYIDNELFTYQNDEYDKEFGDAYRRGDSRGSAGGPDGGTGAHRVDSGKGVCNVGQGAQQAPAPAGGTKPVEDDADTSDELCFKGIPYSAIVEEYWRQDGGRPAPGERHTRVLAMANRFRYITDNNPDVLLRVIDHCGLPDEEVRGIVTAACAYKMAPFTPPTMRKVLQAVSQGRGEALDGAVPLGMDAPGTEAAIPYKEWWTQMRPLLNAALQDALYAMPDEVKPGGAMAALAMLGTYLTRCWWEHYDGERRRLSFLVYIMGDAASGKSFAVELDRLIMEPMKAADRAGREWERQYKEDKAQRATSSAAQKKAAQEIKHPVIRYVPSTISNAKLYARLTDAVELVDGEELHLHLFTFESELATALRVQQGSWAGKLDLECKSFQNEEAGVDYANEQSVNGIIQVNWNQVITGTPDAMNRKIKPVTVLDGLVTRLAMFLMPSNHFHMISRKEKIRDFDAEARLRTWGYKLEELSGELVCPWLVDAAYDWCNERAKEAEMENDIVADYFRKRVPMYIVRYGLVYAVLDNYQKLLELKHDGKPMKVPFSKKALKFALLMGDIIYYMQIRQYGEMVMNALTAQTKDFKPRKRRSRYAELYTRLPNEFTNEQLAEIFGITKNSANLHCTRFVERKWVERVKQGTYRKIIKNV